jgi:hypothetical protein
MYNRAMEFGSDKRRHGRIAGLDVILNRIVRDCPFVMQMSPAESTSAAANSRVVPHPLPHEGVPLRHFLPLPD